MSADATRRTPRLGRVPRLVAMLAVPIAVGGCEWFSTFKDQPRIEPWEAEYEGDTVGFRGNPANSVPMRGGGVPEFTIGLGRFPTVFPTVIDSFATIPNPVPPTAQSVEMGRKYFQINCAVCHGASGAGNGVMLQYGVAAPSIVNERVRGLPDGYLYGMIRNGRGAMANYARIEHQHRWDVVNYVRALQSGGAVDTSSVGRPGDTGDNLPGASPTAPTLPAPFVRHSQAGRAPATAAGTTGATGDTAAAPPAPQPNAGEVRP